MEGQAWDTVLKDLILFYRSGKREAWFYEAIGSGKSFKDSIIGLYETHKILCLKNPQIHFGLSVTSKITILNMSISQEKARTTVFDEMLKKIESSSWFLSKTNWNKDKKTSIEFDKNIVLLPGNSRETTPMSYAIICGILDEACWFTDTSERDNAQEVYDSMKRRIFSRFDTYGRLIVSSSPKYDGDFISRKIGSDLPDYVFYVNKSLFQSKPQQFENDTFIEIEKGIKIPERLKEDYQSNPEKFKRDILGMPAGSYEAYFKNQSKVSSALVLNNKLSGPIIPESFTPSSYPLYIHIDLALRKDSCGFAVAHKENTIVMVDSLFRITPGISGEIQFALIREIIYALKFKKCNIRIVTFDGWQSIDSIQQLTANGINAEVLSVDRNLEVYDTLKEAIYSNKCQIVRDDILKRELLQLAIVHGKKVDHPRGGSKDLSDAVAGSVYNCIRFEGLRDIPAKVFIPSVWK